MRTFSGGKVFWQCLPKVGLLFLPKMKTSLKQQKPSELEGISPTFSSGPLTQFADCMQAETQVFSWFERYGAHSLLFYVLCSSHWLQSLVGES